MYDSIHSRYASSGTPHLSWNQDAAAAFISGASLNVMYLNLFIYKLFLFLLSSENILVKEYSGGFCAQCFAEVRCGRSSLIKKPGSIIIFAIVPLFPPVARWDQYSF